ncbi:hypothetical protein [uncultured Duncaniella sp.]|uniref:hypothetical protein n=1 Tax=uncultured Duncaniella sp. TaxID=2768039 RepID=UPI0025B56CB2|nr:hypothetical protein [uncultured Duncaniella sp.]
MLKYSYLRTLFANKICNIRKSVLPLQSIPEGIAPKIQKLTLIDKNMSKTERSVIDGSDQKLAKRMAREAIQLTLFAIDGLEETMTNTIDLLETVYPESEMTGGKYRPAEYSAAVNLRGRLV